MTTSARPGSTSGCCWLSSPVFFLLGAASVSSLADVPGSLASYLSSAAVVRDSAVAVEEIPKRKILPNPKGRITMDCAILLTFSYCV